VSATDGVLSLITAFLFRFLIELDDNIGSSIEKSNK